MKKVFALFLSVILLAALALPARAAYVSADEAIETLEALGLVKGTGSGFEPERAATRAEAAVMLLRLLGRENDARRETGDCPFADGGWAAAYLTYAWRSGLVKGQSETWYGSGDAVGVRDYLTMVLRALGYSDGEDGDFTWAGSIVFADRIGLTHGEYSLNSDFIREDMALISYTALTLPLKGGQRTLAEQLYLDGAVSASALKATRLARTLQTDKPAYSAAEIHEMSASAVFYLEAYQNGESLNKDKSDAHGSGFFITADGVAVVSYHELDGYAYARATTLDGRRYNVTGVLGYDPLWDLAVIRVSRTDLQGGSVRFFPYLDLGDSDAVYPGERIYAVTNPLGLVDSISEGLISNKSRNVDDPDYPCLQISASISQGSSGGPVLNSHGEVVGVVYGTYVSGQLLNLAIPVNSLPTVSLTGGGIPLRQVKEREEAKRAAAQLSVSKTALHLRYGESAEVMVSHNCPGTANVRYEIDSIGVVTCEWSSFVTKRSVPLTITAVGDGNADVTILFVDGDGNPEAQAVIHVTAYGAPAEED